MGEPVEQQAIAVLQGTLGATVLAAADGGVPPAAPMFAAPYGPIEVPVTGRLSALCCGGWFGPAGFVTCGDCPGVGVEFRSPLLATCGLSGCGSAPVACPSCGLTADDLAAAADPQLSNVPLGGDRPVCPNPWCAGDPGGGCGRTPNQHLEAGVTLADALPAMPAAQRAVIVGDPLYGPQPPPAADGAPTDRPAGNGADAPPRPADGGNPSVALAAPLPAVDEQPAVREPAVAGGVVLRAPASSPPAETEPLRVELTEAVMAYCLNDPRTLQTQIGPSEIGHPCDARITRRVLDMPKYNDRADPWASFVGQAVHAKLADVFSWANAHRLEAGLPEYAVEQRVYVVGDGTDPDDIGGSCDLMRDGLVIDHKIVGNDTMRELKSAGWKAKGGIYSAQLDLYAYGYERAGHTITDVALAAWPRSGFLAGLHIMRRAYDRQAALDAIARLGRIAGDAANLDAANDDAVWNGIIPTAPSKQCAFCPWYDPDRAVPDGKGGYSPRADVQACGYGRMADKNRGAAS